MQKEGIVGSQQNHVYQEICVQWKNSICKHNLACWPQLKIECQSSLAHAHKTAFLSEIKGLQSVREKYGNWCLIQLFVCDQLQLFGMNTFRTTILHRKWNGIVPAGWPPWTRERMEHSLPMYNLYV